MEFRKKTEASPKTRHAGTVMRRRMIALILIFGVGTFLTLFMKLWQIQIRDHDFYAEKAASNQTRDLSVSARRGTITDSKGNNLAISATVQNVLISPKEIIANKADVDFIADGLSKILDIDREIVLKRLENTKSQHEFIAKKVEAETEAKLRNFILNNDLYPMVYLEPDSKRYYPYSSLAAQVVGFINSDSQGAYGLEAKYENELSGQTGRIRTVKSAHGVELPSTYEAYVDAQDGNSLHLTIDTTIQYYAQKVVEEGIKKFEVTEGGFCIVMNPKTGAILANVSLPDYDLNHPSDITDETLQAEMNRLQLAIDDATAALNAPDNPEMPVDKTQLALDIEAMNQNYVKALSDARFSQWISKTVNDLYEPGSTFKPLVVAMGLEEGVISPESTFYCGGSIMVPGWDKPISCHYHAGHGTQNLEKALMNSCNPAMIQIGQKIGAEKFYQYMQDFGLLSLTNVDLQGEGKGIFWTADEFLAGGGNIVSLATASFGQRFEITPIGLITALSSVINGGHLVEPYVVQSVTDTEGNVLSYRDTKEVRQVISTQTADTVRGMMESVVKSGTGKNAFVSGYRIGGKTGTSQFKLETGHLIVSFVGFAPADDPEIIVLLGFDHPKPSAPGSQVTAGGYYISGGNMAASMAGPLIADILDYMGVQKEGSQRSNDATVPSLRGHTLEEAQRRLKNAGFTWKVVGSGSKVTDSVPMSGTAIPSGSAVVLYMGEEKPESKVAVPNLAGKTYNSAKSALEAKGLYLKAPGVEPGSTLVAFDQSIAAGVEVDPGTVIEVRFMDNNVQDFAN